MLIIKLNHLIYAPVMSTGLGFVLANTNFSSSHSSIPCAFFIPFISFHHRKSPALVKIYELLFKAIHILQVWPMIPVVREMCNDDVVFRFPTQ